MSDPLATPKPKAMAGGVEVWCAFDQLVHVDQLRPNPRNPNKHPESQIELLAKAIRYFGWRHTILVSKRSGFIVAGHGRLLAAQKLNLPLVPVDYQEFTSDADEMAVLIGDNRLAELADPSEDELKALLEELDGKIDLDLTGFDATAIENLLPPEDCVGDSPVPLPPDDPLTKQGDIYQLGNHRLMCGDSSLPADVDRLLDGATIYLVNTDPPYNVKVEPRSNNAVVAAARAGFTHHQEFDLALKGKKRATDAKLRPKDRPLTNDFVSAEEFDRLLHAWFGNIARVLMPGGAFYIWGGYSNTGTYPPVLKENGLYFSQAVIWVKHHPVLVRKDFLADHEWGFYGWREGAGHHFYGPNNVPDVWEVKKVPPQKMIHLTEKPLELAVRAMTCSSQPGQNVLDLFGGSGSTLIAADQCDRKSFLMELDPLYCDVIVLRWLALKPDQKILRNGEDVTAAFRAALETSQS